MYATVFNHKSVSPGITSSTYYCSAPKEHFICESDCEVRAVIKFLNAEGVTGSEIHRRLSNIYGAGMSQPKT